MARLRESIETARSFDEIEKLNNDIYNLCDNNVKILNDAARCAHYDKLRTLWVAARDDDDGDAAADDDDALARALFCVLLRYKACRGGGFHAALGAPAFAALRAPPVGAHAQRVRARPARARSCNACGCLSHSRMISRTHALVSARH